MSVIKRVGILKKLSLITLCLTFVAGNASGEETSQEPQTPDIEKTEKAQSAKEKKATGDTDNSAWGSEKTSGFRLAIDPKLVPANPKVPSATNLERRVLRPPTLSAIDYAAWVPRVIFFPFHLVFEYGLRYPLGVVTIWTEKNDIIAKVIDFTSFDDGNASITPRFYLRSGTIPTIGLNFAWDNLFTEGNDYAIGADIGVERTLTLEAQTKIRFWDDAFIAKLGYQFHRRVDFQYYGKGSHTSDADQSGFFRQKHAGELNLSFLPNRLGIAATSDIGILDYRFDCTWREEEEDICGADGKAGTEDDLYDLDSLPFFNSGYQILRLRGHLFWESRDERPASGSGLRLDVFGQVGTSLNDKDVNFVRYGGEAAAFWDFYKQRVVGLRLRSEFAESISRSEIPFSELATLGGIETMRGFSFARFHGDSSLIATLDYRYPIWSFLDANLFFEVGNTFDAKLADFKFGGLRPSVGMSIKTVSSRYNSFDITLALGGHRFDDRFGVDGFNVGFGTNWGF